jgi:hypothetical protein
MADLNAPGDNDNDANVDGHDDAPAQLATLFPTDPIMGLFVEQNPPWSGKWNARMGGTPNADWSGLQLSQIHQATPYHYRKAEMTSDIKGFTVRSTGLTEKFKDSDDLLQFQGRVWKHLHDHGLDAISYLQDPTNPELVLDIINNYSRYMGNVKKSE